MGFVLVGHSRGAREQLTTGTNLRTISSWHDLYIELPCHTVRATSRQAWPVIVSSRMPTWRRNCFYFLVFAQGFKYNLELQCTDCSLLESHPDSSNWSRFLEVSCRGY